MGGVAWAPLGRASLGRRSDANRRKRREGFRCWYFPTYARKHLQTATSAASILGSCSWAGSAASRWLRHRHRLHSATCETVVARALWHGRGGGDESTMGLQSRQQVGGVVRGRGQLEGPCQPRHLVRLCWTAPGGRCSHGFGCPSRGVALKVTRRRPRDYPPLTPDRFHCGPIGAAGRPLFGPSAAM